jgi:hypothetical protein
MNISRRRLTEIVAEEVRRRLRELVEAGEEEDQPVKKVRKPGVSSADQEDPPDAGNPTSPDATVGSPDAAASAPEGGDQPDADPDGPSVDGNSPDPDAVDQDGDAGEDPSGAVSDELSGKTVQAISIEPKSKILPGSKEVVVTFNETTDSLRILVTGTGEVKFFWKNQLYDLP